MCYNQGTLDYDSSSDAMTATISAQSPNMSCITLNITDDATFESDESLFIRLSAMSLGVIFTQDEVTVIIIDNDGTLSVVYILG